MHPEYHTIGLGGRGTEVLTDDADAYQRVLGEELRKLREKKGWTRKDLGRRLRSDISLQTLATYELGTRQCSVVRLVELCLALDELPQNLLATVHRRVFSGDPGQVRVNLAHVIADEAPELLPLRRWARGRLEHTQSVDVRLDPPALERMAELCGMRASDLVTRLRKLSGSNH